MNYGETDITTFKYIAYSDIMHKLVTVSDFGV